MKLWMIDPAFLPDGLLLRQHQTLHAVLNGVLRGKAQRGITGYLPYGGFVGWLHHLTVVEMMRRGLNHETPLSMFWARVPADRRRFDYPIDPAEVRADIALLKAKMRDPAYVVSMLTASLPADKAGMQLVEKQAKLILAGRLPDGAMVL